MRFLDFLIAIDFRLEQFSQRPVWVRALVIIVISGAATWLIAQGLQQGLMIYAQQPPFEGVDSEDPWRETYNANYHKLLWLQYGLWLTGLCGLMVALFFHSLIGTPNLYSDMSRIALGLQLLTMPVLFNGFSIFVCGSLLFCFTPIVFFVGWIQGLRLRGSLWPPIGDWVVLLFYVAYIIALANYSFRAGSVIFVD